MFSKRFEKAAFKTAVKENVKTLYRKTIDEATPQQLFQAVSYAVKDVIIDDWIETQKRYDETDAKTVYYTAVVTVQTECDLFQIYSLILHAFYRFNADYSRRCSSA